MPRRPLLAAAAHAADDDCAARLEERGRLARERARVPRAVGPVRVQHDRVRLPNCSPTPTRVAGTSAIRRRSTTSESSNADGGGGVSSQVRAAASYASTRGKRCGAEISSCRGPDQVVGRS